MLSFYFTLKIIVLALCLVVIICGLYSAIMASKRNLSNNEDFVAVALAVFYGGMDVAGMTMGPENLQNAISIKMLGLIFCMYVIQVSLRNVRQIKLIPSNQNIETIKYNGIDRRKHEA